MVCLKWRWMTAEKIVFLLQLLLLLRLRSGAGVAGVVVLLVVVVALVLGAVMELAVDADCYSRDLLKPLRGFKSCSFLPSCF
jgi:hypothetical protein